MSLDELKAALIRFQVDLSDKEVKVFLQRLDEEHKGYITQSQFLKKFWAAYTYDDLFEAEAARGNQHGLAEKIKRGRMFGAIQQKLRMQCSAQEAFRQLDKGVGFFTVKEMVAHMPTLFTISLKREEFLRLFKEID